MITLATFCLNKHLIINELLNVIPCKICSSFLIFCYYFNRLKAHEISYKIWETRKIFTILHLAPCTTTKRFILKKYIQDSWFTSIIIVWQYYNLLVLFQWFLNDERFHHFIHLCFMLPSNFIALGVKSYSIIRTLFYFLFDLHIFLLNDYQFLRVRLVILKTVFNLLYRIFGTNWY